MIADARAGARPGSLSSGPGRLLVAVYGIFALSAGARAAVQIATDLASAPVAYLLSAFAAAVYLVATVALVGSAPAWRRVAWLAIAVEMAGVLVVGTLSVLDAGDFPEATVWSTYGRGYGFVPLVLPALGLWWLWRTRPGGPAGAGAARGGGAAPGAGAR